MSARARETRIELFNIFFQKFKDDVNNFYSENNNMANKINLINEINENFWVKILMPYFLLKYPKTNQKIFGSRLEIYKIQKFLIETKKRLEKYLDIQNNEIEWMNIMFNLKGERKEETWIEKNRKQFLNVMEKICLIVYCSESNNSEINLDNNITKQKIKEMKMISQNIYSKYLSLLNSEIFENLEWIIIILDIKILVEDNILKNLNLLQLNIQTHQYFYGDLYYNLYYKEDSLISLNLIEKIINITELKNCLFNNNIIDIKKIFKLNSIFVTNIELNNLFLKNNLSNIFVEEELLELKKLFEIFYLELIDNMNNILNISSKETITKIWIYIFMWLLDDYNQVW